jgi:atypical dual specificity phosphatase
VTQQPTPAVARILERARREADFRQRLMAAPLEAVREYDLTEAERRWFVLPNFGWLIPGELAGMARPGSAEALAALAAAGVRVVVNLGERPLPADAVDQAGLRVVELPVADFTAPTAGQLTAAVEAIEQAVGAGQPVAVCCGAGLGRTGTVLAAALVRRGHTPEQAIAEVRARRPGSVETREQAAAVSAFARLASSGGEPG